jgi:hypothetical protein
MPALSRDDERLAAGWLAYTLTKSSEAFAAWDELTMLSTTDEARAWPIVVALVARVPEDELGAVGAGPLENLLHSFAASVGPKAAALARSEPRFRAALERVWLNREDVPPDVREQLVLATNGKLGFMD